MAAHITTEQALQIPQQLKRQSSHSGSDSSPQTNPVESAHNSKYLTDDPVTLIRQQTNHSVKKLHLEQYKHELGQDNAVVRETLRNKLAEYGLNPHTRLAVARDVFGKLEVKGALLQTDIEKIGDDLNSSNSFKQSYERLSQQQPTLNYVDNVVKLSSTYGVANSLFNSLLSENDEFNGLNDISHRYQQLKASTDSENTPYVPPSHNYQFVLNA